MKNNTIDNQQVNLFIAKAWIAWMLDADWCITFWRWWKKQMQPIPIIDICTCCRWTSKVLYNTLRFIWWTWYVMSQYKQSKWMITTRVSWYKRCLKFLQMIEPFLVTKKEEAQLQIKFCESRIARKNEFKDIICKHHISWKEFIKKIHYKPLSEYEEWLIKRSKEIKINRSLRDYNPDVLWLKGEDIVRSNDESVRNDFNESFVTKK